MIHTRNLTKILRNGDVETALLQNVNIDIAPGDFVALLGPSGSGKSTLINMLGLLDKPCSGELFFLGHEISRLTERQRNRLRKGSVGFVFRNFGLIDELTVYENIELPLQYLRYSKKDRHRKVDETLSKFHVSHLRNYYPDQLSSLQKQLTVIGRALINQPEILLADEPTGNLSSTGGNRVMEVLSLLSEEGQTIVMATHSVSEADKGRRVIQLFDGHVVSENMTTRL